LEAIALIVALFSIPQMVRIYASDRAEGGTRQGALEQLIRSVVPPGYQAMALGEFRIYAAAVSLFRRDPRDVERWTYGSTERLQWYAVGVVGVIEAVILDFLFADTIFRWPLIIMNVLAIPYILGLVGRTKAYPHLLKANALVLRAGPGFQIEIPRDNISSLRRAHGSGRGVRFGVVDGVLNLPQGGATDAEVVVESPVQSALGTFTRCRFAVDAPEKLKFWGETAGPRVD